MTDDAKPVEPATDEIVDQFRTTRWPNVRRLVARIDAEREQARLAEADGRQLLAQRDAARVTAAYGEESIARQDKRIAELEADLRNIREAAKLGPADGSVQDRITELERERDEARDIYTETEERRSKDATEHEGELATAKRDALREVATHFATQFGANIVWTSREVVHEIRRFMADAAGEKES